MQPHAIAAPFGDNVARDVGIEAAAPSSRLDDLTPHQNQSRAHCSVCSILPPEVFQACRRESTFRPGPVGVPAALGQARNNHLRVALRS